MKRTYKRLSVIFSITAVIILAAVIMVYIFIKKHDHETDPYGTGWKPAETFKELINSKRIIKSLNITNAKDAKRIALPDSILISDHRLYWIDKHTKFRIFLEFNKSGDASTFFIENISWWPCMKLTALGISDPSNFDTTGKPILKKISVLNNSFIVNDKASQKESDFVDAIANVCRPLFMNSETKSMEAVLVIN